MNKDQEQLLKDIHECLVGNPLKNNKGLVERVENCEAALQKKADKWEWSKLFKVFKIIKTTGV